MSFASAAGRLADSLFERGGSDARWFPGDAGEGTTCKVIGVEPPTVERFGDNDAVLPAGMVRVRKSEIAAPAAGDRVEILDDAGEVASIRDIIGEPRLDKHRNVWLCEAPPRAS